MRQRLALVVLLLGTATAFADEPVGCDKFKWPVDLERAALSTAGQQKVAIGADITTVAAVSLSLKPLAEAGLPKPPERAPKDGTFAAFVRIPNVDAGPFTVSLSEPGWIDVVQNGAYLKPKGFSGVSGCEGLHKVMKFDLATGPVTVQVSGVAKDAVNLVILPAAN